MREIQSIFLGNMNNAAHFLFVSNMAEAAKALQQHIKDYKIDVQARLLQTVRSRRSEAGSAQIREKRSVCRVYIIVGGQ